MPRPMAPLLASPFDQYAESTPAESLRFADDDDITALDSLFDPHLPNCLYQAEPMSSTPSSLSVSLSGSVALKRKREEEPSPSTSDSFACLSAACEYDEAEETHVPSLTQQSAASSVTKVSTPSASSVQPTETESDGGYGSHRGQVSPTRGLRSRNTSDRFSFRGFDDEDGNVDQSDDGSEFAEDDEDVSDYEDRKPRSRKIRVVSLPIRRPVPVHFSRRPKPETLDHRSSPPQRRGKIVPKSRVQKEGPHSCDYVSPVFQQACSGESATKYDMIRHIHEIHGKEEAKHVVSKDLSIERAVVYLADLAEMLAKDATVAVEIRNQAKVAKKRVFSTDKVFSFDGLDLFRAAAVERAVDHRVWKCTHRGCDQTFGSDRSWKRHCVRPHNNGRLIKGAH